VTAVDFTAALQRSTGRLVRTSAAYVVLDQCDPDDVAVLILAQPAIHHAVNALGLIDQMAARHQPLSWGDGSSTVVCTCGSGAYDACVDARLLAGRSQVSARTATPMNGATA